MDQQLVMGMRQFMKSVSVNPLLCHQNLTCTKMNNLEIPPLKSNLCTSFNCWTQTVRPQTMELVCGQAFFILPVDVLNLWVYRRPLMRDTDTLCSVVWRADHSFKQRFPTEVCDTSFTHSRLAIELLKQPQKQLFIVFLTIDQVLKSTTYFYKILIGLFQLEQNKKRLYPSLY